MDVESINNGDARENNGSLILETEVSESTQAAFNLFSFRSINCVNSISNRSGA